MCQCGDVTPFLKWIVHPQDFVSHWKMGSWITFEMGIWQNKVVDTIIDESQKKEKKGVAFHWSHYKYLKKLVIILWVQHFCFSNLWGRQVGDHPHDDIMKFGYKLERKVEKLRIPPLFWQHSWTSLNMVTLEFFFIVWPIVSKKQSFVSYIPPFFFVNKMWKFTPKKTLIVREKLKNLGCTTFSISTHIWKTNPTWYYHHICQQVVHSPCQFHALLFPHKL